MRLITRNEVKAQSNRAFKRWEPIWHENAKKNKENFKQFPSIVNSKVNKKLMLFAYGPSFAENIEAVKKNEMHHEYDVMCVDKALKKCLENRVIPNYVVVADAQVDFEKYGKIQPELCKSIILIATVTSNYKWAEYWIQNGGKVYFTLNKDGIKTHKIFGKYFDPAKQESILIPAASNVFNAAYVFSALILNYTEILLFAADYCYKMGGKYYGDNTNPLDTNYKILKHQFNNHYTMLDLEGNLVQVSHNMSFSSRWLTDFIILMGKEKRNTTVNCTGSGILKIPLQAKISEERMVSCA